MFRPLPPKLRIFDVDLYRNFEAQKMVFVPALVMSLCFIVKQTQLAYVFLVVVVVSLVNICGILLWFYSILCHLYLLSIVGSFTQNAFFHSTDVLFHCISM